MSDLEPETEQELIDNIRTLAIDIAQVLELKSAAKVSVLEVLNEQLTLAIMRLKHLIIEVE